MLCLPVGSCEQHGPHLPLNTDTVIAEAFTELLVERYGERHDLWALPAMPYGLSPEHIWAPGTVTLRAATFLSLLDEVVREYTRATSARHLVIVNGHGGNRGVLETAVHELRHAYGVAVCVIHPSALSPVRTEGPAREVHARVRVEHAGIDSRRETEIIAIDNECTHGNGTEEPEPSFIDSSSSFGASTHFARRFRGGAG